MFDKIETIESAETSVKKLVFTRSDAVAEAVLYKYPTYENRTVICCSTMSGCPVGCRFCGAGDYFVRALSGPEICYQVAAAMREAGVKAARMKRLQIMFMSMGEPLLNKQGMQQALSRLHKAYPNAALLVSTIGPRINYGWFTEASQKIDTIGLQFSIHESTDEARNKLIPFANKLSLREIAQTGERWAEEVGRRPFFNYCAGAHNSTTEDADRLLALFNPSIWECTISVICERNEGLPARNETQQDLASGFASKMLERDYNVRVFDPAGQDDIGGGCGQLWFVQRWMEENPGLAKPSIGKGKPEVHTPTA